MPARIKTHKPARVKDDRDRVQANARQRKRTYHTGSAAWANIRAQVLAAEPLCRECMAQGILSVATVVDHIDGDATNNALSNLQPLDGTCHNRKTRAEQSEKIASNRDDTARPPSLTHATAHRVVKK